MDNNQLATVAILKAQQWFIENGYDVFAELDGKSPFDFVVHKDDKLFRVEVKSTSRLVQSSYMVNLRSTRWNRTTLQSKKFDASKSDICCVYVEPMKKLFIRPSTFFDQKCNWNININNPPVEVILEGK